MIELDDQVNQARSTEEEVGDTINVRAASAIYFIESNSTSYAHFYIYFVLLIDDGKKRYKS